MARIKNIRESELSSLVRRMLGGQYDVIRVETRLDDGWSDLLLINRNTGKVCFLELKQIDNLTKDGGVRLSLQAIQAIFLYQRVLACDHVGSAALLRVGNDRAFIFPAHRNPEWCSWVRSYLIPDELPDAFCSEHRISNLPTALDAAYSARFSSVALPPQELR